MILATDGDFNVGTTNRDELIELIQEHARGGVFLTALGFGSGNLNEAVLEGLADHGNGNYAYIDSIHEARKVLVSELGSTLVTVAKDVKLQVVFDPRWVAAHRLVGYDNRRLAHADFENDLKDAGDLGAGHHVTALFELVPPSSPLPEALETQTGAPAEALLSLFTGRNGILGAKVRYKDPQQEQSRVLIETFRDEGRSLDTASDSLRFSAAVAWFGQELRSERGPSKEALAQARSLAASSLGADPGGYRAGFLDMVSAAMDLD